MSPLRTHELAPYLSRLAEALAAHPLARKVVLAPSRRAGQQWLEQIAGAGGAVLNVEVETLKSFAAGVLVRAEGAAPPLRPDVRTSIAVERLLDVARAEGVPFLKDLVPSLGLVKHAVGALAELRMADIPAEALRSARLERWDKARGLAWLLEQWEGDLRATGETDGPGLFRRAAEAVVADPGCIPADLVFMPADLRAEGRDARFLDRLGARLTRLEHAAEYEESPSAGARRLAWFQQPAEGPTERDGSTVFQVARGEVNEVRQILRRCLADGIPLDEIELLYTDTAVYAPLLYESAELLFGGEAVPLDELPVTFADGVPIRYGRPARALAEWLSWRREDFPQTRAVRMVREGLLAVPDAEAPASRLAGSLRGTPIVFGRERYLEQLDGAMEAAERRAKQRRADLDDADEPIAPSHDPNEECLRLSQLRRLFADLLSITPEDSDPPQRVLQCAQTFLNEFAGGASKFDAYVRKHLLDVVEQLTEAAGDEGGAFDVAARLEEVARTASVGGQAPRPGALHAAPLASGGHSGRPRLVIVGLDDGRFPWGASQDPLLLDHERRALSPHLETSAQRQQRSMDELASLFARQRGTAALSYSIESVTDGSPRAPSPALLGAFRVAMGAPQARPAELLDQAGPPASFAPAKAGEALHGGEWRLARIKDGVGAEEVEADYPLIAQGRLAEERRAAAAFTEYDGYAPASASSEQLTAPGGPIVSAHRLETLGACPRRYFYRYVLGLQPFEDIEADPAGWLDAREAGALIHETFRAFMAAAQPQGGPMGEGSHWPLMRRIIDEQVERKRRQLPPRTAGAVERHRRLVEDAARMFLAEEARRPAGIVPRYFEASVGMTSEEQTPLDATAPAEVKVAGGLLRLRGRIDRVDELQGRERPEFRLIDYKTGGTSRYKGIHKDPFLEGRLIQHALYIRLAEPRLKTLHGAEAQVRRFSYYFPGERGAGRVLTWTPAQLNEGRHVIEKLCAIVEAGAYGPTENEKDCAYCDYASVCGDPRVISGQGATMMAHEANTALAHLAALRERSNRKT